MEYIQIIGEWVSSTYRHTLTKILILSVYFAWNLKFQVIPEKSFFAHIDVVFDLPSRAQAHISIWWWNRVELPRKRPSDDLINTYSIEKQTKEIITVGNWRVSINGLPNIYVFQNIYKIYILFEKQYLILFYRAWMQ